MGDFIYMVFLQKQTIGTENRSMVAKGWRWWKSLITKGQQDILGMMELFCIFTVATKLYTFAKTHTKKGDFTVVDHTLILKLVEKSFTDKHYCTMQ